MAEVVSLAKRRQVRRVKEVLPKGGLDLTGLGRAFVSIFRKELSEAGFIPPHDRAANDSRRPE